MSRGGNSGGHAPLDGDFHPDTTLSTGVKGSMQFLVFVCPQAPSVAEPMIVNYLLGEQVERKEEKWWRRLKARGEALLDGLGRGGKESQMRGWKPTSY